MRNQTGRRRSVRVLGGFLVAVLAASGAILASVGVASAAAAGATNWSVIGNPTSLRQNTQGSESLAITIVPPVTVTPQAGVAAALQFDLPTYTSGDTIDLVLAPDDSGHAGAQCRTNPQPQGVNQSDAQEGNFVGFAKFNPAGAPGPNGGVTPGIPLPSAGGTVLPPLVDGTGVGPAPHFTFELLDPISCSLRTNTPIPGSTAAEPLGLAPSLANGSYARMRLTLTTSGSNGHVILGQGVSQVPLPDATGPLLYDIGFGVSVGPVHVFVGTGSATAEIASNATVVGQKPSANTPPSHLTRSTTSDAVGGPISEFKIIENVPNALPPTDGTPGQNPMGANQFSTAPNQFTHLLRASAPGAVCVVLDNLQGNALQFDLPANGWSVSPNAGTSSFSGTTGSAAVVDNDTSLYLPVTSSSNQPATWTTTGLVLKGLARADGPVYAWAYWLDTSQAPAGDTPPPLSASCNKSFMDLHPAYKLGYVQIATISELATSVFGANAEGTAAEAVDHQFDSFKGDCVSNTIGPDFFFGPSIFLARSDQAGDALGASFAAGTINSGVLLTPTNSLDLATRTQLRRQGVATVFVVGGPLAISDAVFQQLQNTPAWQCGGTSPRINPLTNEQAFLNVMRIAGPTVYDTNRELATFQGAEPPAAFGKFGATNQFNSTTGKSTTGTAPGAAVNTALIVTGENFQDAMVASVPAYGGDFLGPLGSTGPMPLIATTPNALSPQAVASIFDQHIGQALVVGGPLAVSDAVMDQLAALGVYSIRIAGIDNTETSTQLASFELATGTNAAGTPLGFGYLNFDPDWDAYVNRTAGGIQANTNPDISARMVLMARGDQPFDAMAAAAVLSVHNGRFKNDQKFPLITTVNPTTLGPAVTAFLQNASLPISTLTGWSAPRGRNPQTPAPNTTSNPFGSDCNNKSSNVFTIQPVGGPLALSDALRAQAVGLIGSTALTPIPGTFSICNAPV